MQTYARNMAGARAASIALVLGIMLSILGSTTAHAASIAPVTNDSAGAATLASAMVADGTTMAGAGFNAVPGGGTPHGVVDSLGPFPTQGAGFGILTTGNVDFADDPNNATNTSADLGGLPVRGDTDLDVTVMKVDLAVPSGVNCLRLDFAFYSEEFPEYVGSPYNDGFIAELDASTWSTAGSAISAPGNFAFDPTGDVISVNSTGATSMDAGNAAGTTYDGATTLLEAATQVGPGAHSLFLSVFDQGDRILDSAAFVDNVRLVQVPDPAVQCKPGATPKTLELSPATATSPVGTPHTVTASAKSDGQPVAGVAVSLAVTGANTTSGSCVTAGDGQCPFTYVGTAVGDDDITATATIDGDAATADATKEWTPAAGADLSITKTDSADPVLAGGQLNYSIGVTNNGPGTATQVEVKDALPAGVTLVSASSGAGNCGTTAGTVTCGLGDIAAGGGATVKIGVVAQARGQLVNTATVSATTPDPNPQDNQATATTTVVGAQGSAFGEQVRSLLVNSGPLPAVSRSTPGTSSLTAASVSLPGILTANALKASTTIGPDVVVRSAADAAKAKVGPSVATIEAVHSECTATASGASGRTRIGKLAVAGKTLLNVEPGPNSVLTVPGVATITLNEQTRPEGSTSIVVNAVHVKLLNALPGLGTDLIVGQSRCVIAP